MSPTSSIIYLLIAANRLIVGRTGLTASSPTRTVAVNENTGGTSSPPPSILDNGLWTMGRHARDPRISVCSQWLSSRDQGTLCA